MTSMSPESAVAGRLEVPVESDLRGFGKRLKKKVEAAAKNVRAEVKVEPDTKRFKSKLEKAVRKAAAGVKAEVQVDLDAGSLKAKLEALARAGATHIKVHADVEGVDAEVAAAMAEAETVAARRPVKIPLRTAAGLWLEVLREKWIAQRVANKNPIEIPVRVGRGRRLRGWLRGGILVGIISLIQPAVGAIGALVGGLGAITGAAAPATGALAALPLGLSALIQGMLGTTVAAGGLGEAMGALAENEKALADGTEWTAEQQKQLEAALEKLSPSARKFAEEVVGLRDEWSKIRRVSQEALFSRIADQVKPLADVLLPKLRKGFRQTSAAVGDVARETMLWLQTPRALRNIDGVMRQNNGTIRAGGTALRYFIDGFLIFQRAAEPFQKRMDRWITRSGKWFRDTMRTNRLNGDTAVFLEKAGDRLSQVWSITKRLGSGLQGVFRAGEESGVRLLTSLENWLTKWDQWVNSDEGRTRITAWFDAVEPAFREIGYMIRDTFNAIVKWAEDPKITDMLRMLRTELGPALNDFLVAISGMMGENTIKFLTELTRVLNNLEPMLSVFSTLASALLMFVDTLNSLAEAGGPATDALFAVLGALLAYRSLKRVLGILRFVMGMGRKGGMFAGIAGGARGAVGALAGAALSILTLGRNADSTNRKMSRLERTMRRAKNANTKPRRPGGTPPPGPSRRGGAVRAGAGAAAFLAIAGPGAQDVIDTAQVGERIDQAFIGLARRINENGKVAQAAYQDVLSSLANTDVGKYAADFGLNLERMAQGIVDQSNTQYGTAASKYLNQVLADIGAAVGDKGMGNSLKAGLSALWGGNTNLKADRVNDAIGKVIAALEEASRKAAAAGAQARKAKAQIDAFFNTKGGSRKDSPKSDAPPAKDLGNLLTPNLPKGGGQAPEKQATGFANRIQRAFARIKPKPIPAPKIDTSKLKTQVGTFTRMMNRAFNVKGKPIQPPKFNGAPARKAAEETGRAIWQRFRQAANQSKQAMNTGMNGVVTGIRSKKGPARGAATQVANATKQPFQGLAPAFNALGLNAMQGLVNGIRAKGAQAVAEARSVAAQVAAAARTELDVRSPSRVMQQIGEYVSEGFALGIARGSTSVAKARKKLLGLLTKAGWSAKERARFEKATAKEFRGLEKIARRWEQVAGRMERARKRQSGALFGGGKKGTQQRKEFTRGLVDGAKEYGSLSALSQYAGGLLTPDFAISELTRRVASTAGFRKNLRTLRKKGLGNRAYRQLLEAGIEEGAPLAEQLLGASPAQLAKINALQAKLAGVAKRMGRDTGRSFKMVGGTITKGMIEGLRDNQRGLNKAAKAMADQFVRQIKKALRIKSPSRVMAGIGGQTIDGMSLGVNRGARRLMGDAQRISGDLARSLTPDTHARSLYTSRAGSKFRTHEAPRAAAPLVGELTIVGRTPEEIQDALDQTMFALRKIRQGGVHASRTA